MTSKSSSTSSESSLIPAPSINEEASLPIKQEPSAEPTPPPTIKAEPAGDNNRPRDPRLKLVVPPTIKAEPAGDNNRPRDPRPKLVVLKVRNPGFKARPQRRAVYNPAFPCRECGAEYRSPRAMGAHLGSHLKRRNFQSTVTARLLQLKRLRIENEARVQIARERVGENEAAGEEEADKMEEQLTTDDESEGEESEEVPSDEDDYDAGSEGSSC